MSDDVLIDALPYIDSQYSDDAELHALVDSLIQQEMARMVPRDYLAAFPAPASSAAFAESVFLQAELARVAAGTAQTPFLPSFAKVRCCCCCCCFFWCCFGWFVLGGIVRGRRCGGAFKNAPPRDVTRGVRPPDRGSLPPCVPCPGRASAD